MCQSLPDSPYTAAAARHTRFAHAYARTLLALPPRRLGSYRTHTLSPRTHLTPGCADRAHCAQPFHATPFLPAMVTAAHTMHLPTHACLGPDLEHMIPPSATSWFWFNTTHICHTLQPTWLSALHLHITHTHCWLHLDCCTFSSRTASLHCLLPAAPAFLALHMAGFPAWHTAHTFAATSCCTHL